METSGQISDNKPRAALGALARQLQQRSKILAHAAKVKAGEAKVLASHCKQFASMRDGTRTRANLVYSFGSIAERGGYLDIDDYAIAGLEHHGVLYAGWMAQAASENPACSRGDLLRIIFSEKHRLKWCVREGARLAWEFSKAASDAETDLFRSRQGNPNKHWRKEPMTARQFWMITLICVRGDFEMPVGLRNGPAHDWIARHGGHPNFWKPPMRAPAWNSEDLTNLEE